jgi:outer membrane protein assembly factor BamE
VPLALARRCDRALAGCQSLQTSDGVVGMLTPYKMEIVQGNVITSEQAAAIKPG